jgi:hypothetical protein
LKDRAEQLISSLHLRLSANLRVCLFTLVSPLIVLVLVVVLIVGPKLFIEPGTKAFFRLSSVSGPGL